MATREDMIKEGYVWFCLSCHKCFKTLPTENYEDGHGGRQIEMCRCGCDIFSELDETAGASSNE